MFIPLLFSLSWQYKILHSDCQHASPKLTLCISLVLAHEYTHLYVFAVVSSGVVEVLTSLAQSFFGKG